MKIVRNIILLIRNDLFNLWYHILFYSLYGGNMWMLYESYHKKKRQWKKNVWNRYMVVNSASISIDAKIASPLILPHGVNGIFISQSASIGKNVVIFQHVTIGANTIKDSKSYGAPTIGNNVYIGAGAKIIGGGIWLIMCELERMPWW